MRNKMRQRQQKILQHVQKTGLASLGELAQMFGVSVYTIRRDVDYLAQARLAVIMLVGSVVAVGLLMLAISGIIALVKHRISRDG